MEHGGNFAIATGRSKMSGSQYFAQTNPNATCVLLNGAILYDFKKKELLMKRCLPDGAMAYLKRVEELFPEIGVEVYTDEDIYITKDGRTVQKHIENENLRPGGSQCRTGFRRSAHRKKGCGIRPPKETSDPHRGICRDRGDFRGGLL